MARLLFFHILWWSCLCILVSQAIAWDDNQEHQRRSSEERRLEDEEDDDDDDIEDARAGLFYAMYGNISALEPGFSTNFYEQISEIKNAGLSDLPAWNNIGPTNTYTAYNPQDLTSGRIT